MLADPKAVQGPDKSTSDVSPHGNHSLSFQVISLYKFKMGYFPSSV